MNPHTSSFQRLPWTNLALLLVVLSVEGSIIYSGLQWPLSIPEILTISAALSSSIVLLVLVQRAEWKRSNLSDPDSSWLPWILRGLLSIFLSTPMIATAVLVLREGNYLIATLFIVLAAFGFFTATLWFRTGMKRYQSARRSPVNS